MPEYDPQIIEPKWQRFWEEHHLYHVENDVPQPRYYVLEQFPYPSGDLHMGHMRVYSIGDVLARFRRMNGYHVLHPMGYDAFGLPAENAAIENGADPRQWTLHNIERMRGQQQRLGLSYDWSRQVITCLPDYYRFTQWMFLLMYKRGLAYRKKQAVNWCPGCQTVLANEQVEDGRCWRCDSLVEKRELEQWSLRITAYADRLLDDLDKLGGWPERVRTMQRNWIGRSFGAKIHFPIFDQEGAITVFTTRPDTLAGATYLVLAPEHPWVARLVHGTPYEAAVEAFVTRIRNESEIERTAETTTKEGLFIGAWARNPLTGERIPIWIADYVLPDYGTGAVMGVPAHDTRDFAFASKYGLPIVSVIQPEGALSEEEGRPSEPYVGPGRLIRSGTFDGMPNEEAKKAIVTALHRLGQAEEAKSYRLRDWLISRQRYWGAPIPIVYCDRCGIVPVPEDQLPVLLPEDVRFEPGVLSPLARVETFVQTRCPHCGGPARRETDTMDTFMCSSWYFYRYISPKEEHQPFSSEAVNQWMPVDAYVGGIEHAVLHLLYSRFFCKVLYDAGLVAFDEPFTQLIPQGMVLNNGAKMSKSKGNGVAPDDIVRQYGADAGRLFILFAAPPDRDFEWSDAGIEGSYRFLQRLYRLVREHLDLFPVQPYDAAQLDPDSRQLHRKLHQTIRKVTQDISQRNNFNTAIAAVMELVNACYAYPQEAERHVLATAIEQTVLLMAPFVPHLAEELWAMCAHEPSVHQQPWPKYDEAALQTDEIEIAVQLNGRVRARMRVPSDADKAAIEAAVLRNQAVQQLIGGRPVRRAIVVPGKLVNLVV